MGLSEERNFFFFFLTDFEVDSCFYWRLCQMLNYICLIKQISVDWPVWLVKECECVTNNWTVSLASQLASCMWQNISSSPPPPRCCQSQIFFNCTTKYFLTTPLHDNNLLSAFYPCILVSSPWLIFEIIAVLESLNKNFWIFFIESFLYFLIWFQTRQWCFLLVWHVCKGDFRFAIFFIMWAFENCLLQVPTDVWTFTFLGGWGRGGGQADGTPEAKTNRQHENWYFIFEVNFTTTL